MSATTQRAPIVTSTWYSRHRLLLECTLIGLLIAGAFVLRVWSLSKVHFWDEAVYLQNAEVILGNKFNYSELDFRAPLLSLIFAAVFLVWHHIYAAAIVTALLNAAGPALLYLSGRKIVGRLAAGIAGLLLAFAPFFVGAFPDWFPSDNTGNSLLSDSPALTIILLAFWLLLRALRRQSDLRFACVGFVFSLAVLMRFASLSSVFALSLLIFAAARWWRAALACAAGFFAGLGPYFCWSRLRYGGFLETFLRGWRYYEGDRESPLFYARNFGTIFCWITLAGLVLWVGRWAWRRSGKSPRYPTPLRGAGGTWGTDPEDVRLAGLPGWLESYLWLWAAVALVFFFALRHQEPRYIMPVAPPLFLLAGSGLSVLLTFRNKSRTGCGNCCGCGGARCQFLARRRAFPIALHRPRRL